MKKVLLPMLMVLSGFGFVKAQDNVFNNPLNTNYFGLRVGGDITCPGKISADNVGVSVFNNGGGFELGGIYNVPIVANFYFEPGLKFFYDSYSLKKDMIGFTEDDIIMNNASIKKIGIRIPLMFGYRFDFTENVNVSVFTGPEIETGIVGKSYVNGYNIEISESIYGDDGGMKRTNVLWGIGAGIAYQKFCFGIQGGIGMVNMLKDSYATFHENRVTFSLGYNF